MKRRAKFSETSRPRGPIFHSETRSRDKDLVVAFKEGDLSAFSVIDSRYRSAAQQICRRYLRNPHDVEDAVQEVMLRAFSGLSRFDGEYALGAWVERIARNLCLDILRARARRPHTVQEPLQSAWEVEATGNGGNGGVDPGEVVEILFKVTEVRDALERLPIHHKKALLLREIEGRSHEEIANHLGISRSQAKALIHRAKRSFRRVWVEGGRRLRSLLPPFLFLVPSTLAAWLSRVPPQAAVAECSAKAASCGPVSAAAGERVLSGIAAAVVAAGAMGMGAVATSKPESPQSTRQIERIASPVMMQAGAVLAPGGPVSSEADPVAPSTDSERTTGEEEGKVSPDPSSTPSPTANEGEDSLSGPADTEPNPGSSPTPIDPPPSWSLAFTTSASSSDQCGCQTEPGLFSLSISGEAGAGLAFSQEAEGAAFDAEGDPAWRLWIEYAGEADEATGTLTARFYLAGGASGYEASATLGELTRESDGTYTYSYEGTYRLVDGILVGGPPPEGSFTALISFWGDGTTLYRSAFSLSEAASS